MLHGERGADQVAEALPGAILCAVNLAEVVGKLVDAEVEARQLRALLVSAGVVIKPFGAEDAELAGALRSVAGGRRLSLGDRCCLAVAVRSDPAEVLTGDRAWAGLDIPVRVVLCR